MSVSPLSRPHVWSRLSRSVSAVLALSVCALGALAGCGAPPGETAAESSEALGTHAVSACVGVAVPWTKANPGCLDAQDDFCNTVQADYAALQPVCTTPIGVTDALGIEWYYSYCPTGAYALPITVSTSDMGCTIPATPAPYAQVVTWEHIMTPKPGGCVLGRCPPGAGD